MTLALKAYHPGDAPSPLPADLPPIGSWC